MKKPALIIKELSIFKMPGFPNGMESITSLADHINVIAGPNASGKSSTARIIQDVIWKQNIDRIHVETRLAINAKTWDIKIDSGHYSSQSNGVDESLPSIPAYDESKRYYLALHELIKEDDKNLAAEILRETIGGYDLQKAQEVLGFRSNTPNLGLSEYKDFEAKRNIVEAIENEQIALQNKEKKLTTLKEKQEQAKRASRLSQLYTYLIDFLYAKRDYKTLESEKTSYPEQMPLVIGNEFTDLSKLEKKIEGNDQEIERIGRAKTDKEDELAALPIPKDGFEKVLLDELNENAERLAELERNLQTKQIENSKNEAETRVVLHRLFATLKREDIEALDLENIQDLDRFFEDAHDVLNKKKSIENEIQDLRRAKKAQNHSEENLHVGINLLLNWFEKDAVPQSSSKWVLWILLILGVIIVPLTYFYGWIGFAGVFAMALIILISLRLSSSKADARRKTRASDFKKTGIPEPATWQEPDVSKRIEELHLELHEAKRQNEIKRRLVQLDLSLEQIDPELRELEIKRQTWIDKLSDIPELTVDNIEKYSGLYWFLKNLQQWQKHNNQLEASRLAYEKEKGIYSQTLAKINSLLAGVDVESVSDAASAKATIKNMHADENNRVALLRDIENLRAREVDFNTSNANDIEEINSIYSRLKLEIGAKEALRELVSKKEAYDEFAKEFEHAHRRLNEKEIQLQAHPLYADVSQELPNQIEEAEERNEQYARTADEAESLNKDIATIEAHIGRERTGHELEAALTERDSALDKLEEHYQNTLGSITGDVILNGLKKKTQEHSNSKVFNRANELFNKITHGHYELILDDKEGGSFRAKDTVRNQGQPLDHLSSGTRIQLLIAVRLAFIESQESGIALPILADEVLANSDDARAKQIIEALVEISKEGRQVFYFTAQTDELRKWSEYLNAHPEISGKTVVLKGQPNAELKYEIGTRSEMPSLEFATIPAPNGHSREAYHKLLNPSRYNLLVHTPEQLHLAYLIDDNHLLHACLQRGIRYYGQLKSFVNHQGELEGLNESTLEAIDLKVELLEDYQKLYQVGRPKPIDREVLRESGSVSDTFMDTVDTKLKELDHNPELLIAALRGGEVSRFTTAKTDELEAYFFEHNYLDGNEPLTPEELTIRTHAILSKLELSQSEANRFLQRLMA